MLMQRDRWPHKHGNIEHTHAWASIQHDHLLRGICGDEACKGTERHNIHPAPRSVQADRGRVLTPQ
jgi:hypothetical protein